MERAKLALLGLVAALLALIAWQLYALTGVVAGIGVDLSHGRGTAEGEVAAGNEPDSERVVARPERNRPPPAAADNAGIERALDRQAEATERARSQAALDAARARVDALAAESRAVREREPSVADTIAGD